MGYYYLFYRVQTYETVLNKQYTQHEKIKFIVTVEPKQGS